MNDQTPKPQTRIARRLLKWVLAVSTVLTLIFTGIQAFFDYRASLASINEHFDQINSTLSPGISTALWGFDRQTLLSQAEGILHFPHVRYVEIRGTGDFSVTAGRKTGENSLVRNFPLQHLYNGRTVVLGTLHIQADTSRVMNEVLTKVAVNFLFQFITIALVSIFLLMMFNRLVTRHIALAAVHFRKFDVDEQPLGLSLKKKHRGDEIDILCDAFNSLREKLVNSYRDLRESEQRFKTLFDKVAVGVAEIEIESGRFITANTRYAQILGLPVDKLLTSSFRDRTHPDDVAAEANAMRQLVKNEIDEFTMEKRLIRDDGVTVWVNMSVTPMWRTAGQPFHLIAVVEDISDRKRAEGDLLLLSQRLKLATASGKLGVWDWGVKENILVWDDRMLELYGLSRDAFTGRVEAWSEGLHEDDRDRAYADLRAALAGEREFDTVFRVRHPDGKVVHVKANGLVIRDADGTPTRMIGINADITQQVLAEEERKGIEAQLQQAQKMESVGRLAGGVAHDFNNMLSVIVGRAELGLLKLPPDHPVYSHLQEIGKAAERSADLTRQLLAFARKQTVSPKVLDLNEAVSVMLKMLQRLIGEDIVLTWRPAAGLWPVKIDPSQVDQIVANLCVNARDAIRDTGRITIETDNCTVDADYCAVHPDAAPGDYVRLTVSDDGIGMDEETEAHVFEPFFTTKGIGKGTGLGLATVYGAVRQNDGFIAICSERGRGTTFSIYLPRSEGHGVPAPLPSTVPAAVRGKETILLVEDEPAILDMSVRLLEEQGYTVLPASRPEEAIQLAQNHTTPIHLLMTDVVMPGMNGRDLANRLLSINPRMKRLFMSGYTADVIADHGVLNEGVCFIQKPFNLPALAAKVREVLDEK